MTKMNRIQTLLEHTPFPGAGQTLGKVDVIESVVDLPGRNWEIHFRGNLTKSAVKSAIKELVANSFALPISDEYSLVGFRPRGFTHARSNPGGDVTIVRGHMYYARPNPTTSKEFQTEMDDMLITNPEKYFNKYSAKTPEALRTKLFSFVSLTGESYGWHMPNGDVHHRRASIIMPKIKINKALKGAKMFYHTHPSKDEPSLTSADDYQFYLDLHFAWGITTFYTIMKHKMDKFTIKGKPGGKEKYLRMEEETFCNAVDGLIDLGEKKALTEVDASAPDTDYQNKTTANMVAAFNKKYKSIAEISFRAFVKPHAPSTLAQKAATGTEAITGIRSNPRPNPPIKVEDKYIAKALQELKGLDYAFEHYGGDEYAHTMYVYWWLKHHLYPTQEYVSGRLFKLNDYGMDSDTRQKLRAYLSQTIIGNWTYLDATMLLGLYHDIAKLREKEPGARKGWEIGAQMFLSEVGPELGLPAKLTEDLTHVLETDIGRKGISDKAFATQVGTYYGVSKLVQMADLMAHHPLMYTGLARQAKETGLMEGSGGDNFKTHKMKQYSAEIVEFLNEGELPRSNPLPRARYIKWVGKYSSGNFDPMVVEENLQEFDQRYVADKDGKMKDKQGGSGGQFFYMRFNNTHLDDIPIGKVIKGKLALRSGTFDVDIANPPRDFGEEMAQKLYTIVGKELKESYPDLELEAVETEVIVNPRKAARVQVITLSGPSGGGKTTVLKYLAKKLPNASTPPTYTTRPRRPNEQGAHDRRFVSKERFHEMVEKSMLVEWVRNPNGHFYGRAFDDFRGDFAIVDVTLAGKKLYEKRFPNIFTVFLDPHPSVTTKARAQALHRRGGMSKAEAKKRAMAATNMVKVSRSMDFDSRVTMKPGAYDQGAKKVLSEIPMDNPRVPWVDITPVDVPDLARGLERINVAAHRKRVRINTQYATAVEFNRILEVQDPNYVPFIGPMGLAEYSTRTKIGNEKQGLVPIGEAADLEATERNTSLDRWTRNNPKGLFDWFEEQTPEDNPTKPVCPLPPKKGIIIYGASWCGPCRMTKEYLDKQGKKYKYVDIETVKDYRKRIHPLTNNYGYIPVIFIDGKFLEGGYTSLIALKNPRVTARKDDYTMKFLDADTGEDLTGMAFSGAHFDEGEFIGTLGDKVKIAEVTPRNGVWWRVNVAAYKNRVPVVEVARYALGKFPSRARTLAFTQERKYFKEFDINGVVYTHYITGNNSQPAAVLLVRGQLKVDDKVEMRNDFTDFQGNSKGDDSPLYEKGRIVVTEQLDWHITYTSIEIHGRNETIMEMHTTNRTYPKTQQIGYIRFYAKGDWYWIDEIYVAKEFRGYGWLSELFRQLIGDSPERLVPDYPRDIKGYKLLARVQEGIPQKQLVATLEKRGFNIQERTKEGPIMTWKWPV